MKRLLAILRLRCPRCLTGRVFQGLLRMHAVCPQCSLSYAREPGFFMGAMYFSYALGILAALPLCLYLVIARIPPIWAGLAAVGQLALLSPFLLRYSRVMWLHFDQRFDPR